MSFVRNALAAVLLTVSAGALVACGDDEPSGDTAHDSAGATGDADAGGATSVEVVDLPDLKGAYATALDTYLDFEEGRWLVAGTGEMNRQLSFSAVGSLANRYRAAADDLTAAGTSFEGDVVVEVLDARPLDTVLELDVCVDATALQVPDGAPELLARTGRVPERVTVTNLEGPWRVTDSVPGRGSC